MIPMFKTSDLKVLMMLAASKTSAKFQSSSFGILDLPMLKEFRSFLE